MIKQNYEVGYFTNLFYRESQYSQRNKARLSLIQRHKKDGRLLEVGCGMGGFLQVAEEDFDVEGIDVSRFAIRSLRTHFGCRVHAYNVEQWPAPKRKYDVIAIFNTLEHLKQPKAVVEKMQAALNDDGMVIGSVPNNSGIVGKLITRMGNFFDRTHVSVFTPSTWWGIFREAGFSTIRFFGEVTVGRNRSYYLSTKDWHQYSFNLMFLCAKEVRID